MDYQEESWRTLLSRLTRDPAERTRIALALGIREGQIERWVRDEADPHRKNLYQLVRVIPEEARNAMITLLRRDFPDFQRHAAMEETISSTIIMMVLDAFLHELPALRHVSISALVLRVALAHLDPEERSAQMTLFECFPESLEPVTSLVVVPVWGTEETPGMFVGAESLAGYATSHCKPVFLNDTRSTSSYPLAPHERQTRSLAALPLHRRGQVAGCLLVTSRESNFFNQLRHRIVLEYSYLLTLAYEYFAERITLKVMQPWSEQASVVSAFRERVSHLLLQRQQEGEMMALPEAEQQIRLELEQELTAPANRANY